MAAGMLHTDLRERLVLDTGAIPWVASPESGRATSIVRYEPGACFHAHQHPMGEEFFVLEGTFSDEHGNYPAGSYVLNPPDSGHTPWTRDGCVLFVKLCQYAGPGRRRIVADSARMEWRPSGTPGIAIKEFYSDSSHPERVALIKWELDARYPRHSHPGGEEILVLEGRLSMRLGAIRTAPGSAIRPAAHTSRTRPKAACC